jgi:hypothetical protein
MSNRCRIVILGTMGNVPYAGMAWMHGQFLMALARLGHDVAYIETTTAWPYHPLELTTTMDPTYTLGYLQKVMQRFGLPDRWAYRTAYSDGTWHGPMASQAERFIQSADAVFNITGATAPEELDIPCRLVYIGTDPVIQELKIANGDEVLRQRLAAHDAHFTYGENIGSQDCPVPPLPFPTKPMRQPIVMDMWENHVTPRPEFTTVTNWEVTGYDVVFNGEVFTWSKHHALQKMIELPTRTTVKLELAMGLSGVSENVRSRLRNNGWAVVDAYQMSLDPWSYRNYIIGSSGEVSVAKDMVVRLHSGWFSERSACYLAAGRPVVTQDTAFSKVLPTGAGLFAFKTMDEAIDALDRIERDYSRQSAAAREIASEYFDGRKVLGQVLSEIGL